jgi:hypothetical protein
MDRQKNQQDQGRFKNDPQKDKGSRPQQPHPGPAKPEDRQRQKDDRETR